MSRINLSNQDSLFGPWVATFASVATANITALNLTSGQATTLTAMATAFGNAYEDSQAAKSFAQGKVGMKDNARQACEDLFRPTAKIINANPNISDELKAELGLTITPSVSGPVEIPTELTANGLQNGQNILAWDRNGNVQGTTFLIECRRDASGPWQFAGVTTKTKFTHNGQVPGQMITYRVSAIRDDFQSGASNQATIYEISEVEPFTLKQAA